MKVLWRLCFVIVSSSLMLAQSNTSPETSASPSTVTDQIKALRETLTEQQRQIAQQQQQIQNLQQQVAARKEVAEKDGSASSHLINASLTSTNASNPAALPASDTPAQEKPKE